jgi:hypothetical protein
MKQIQIYGRNVWPITTDEARRDYSRASVDSDYFVPVEKDGRWALFTRAEQPVQVTEYAYSVVMPEREGEDLFFVQDAETGKWGVLAVDYARIHDPAMKPLELMPPIADEIYEDSMYFHGIKQPLWMTRCKDKIGILTLYGYSDIAYKSYEIDDENASFKLNSEEGYLIVEYCQPYDYYDRKRKLGPSADDRPESMEALEKTIEGMMESMARRLHLT